MQVNQHDRQLAAETLKLLAKAALTGAEVPLFVAVHNWLTEIRDTNDAAGLPPMPAMRANGAAEEASV